MSASRIQLTLTGITIAIAAAATSCSNGSGGAAAGKGSGGNQGASTEAGGTAVNSTTLGGSGYSGGATNTDGTSNVAAGASSIAPGSYALNPPDPCNNQFYVPNCTQGNAATACGGVCSSINACQESTASKPGADVTFLCPRFMLYSDEMTQAAIDDGNTAFNYAVVGHDVDTGGIDGAAQSSCCQCYQLIFDYPAENQANVDASQTGPSAIPIPPPLIVQSFNTGTNGS